MMSGWKFRISELRERLQQPIHWFPFPALLSFGLVLVLGGHLLPGLNPRLGSKANVLRYHGEKQPFAGLWLSIHHENGRVVVTSTDHRFSWPADTLTTEALQPLVRFLQDKVRIQALAMGLSGDFTHNKTTAILAVDQNLNYIHVRPVIYALAQASITNYGFEIRLP